MGDETSNQDDVISIVANRYSPAEIESALYFLGGCLFICLLAFLIAAWIRSQADSPWQPLVKPISFNKKGKIQVQDCRPFDAYGTKGKKKSWWKRLLKRLLG